MRFDQFRDKAMTFAEFMTFKTMTGLEGDLADIDRDKQGIVTIDWPEFLEIVAKLQNPRKCRGGKPGLVRLRPEASRPSSSSS